MLTTRHIYICPFYIVAGTEEIDKTAGIACYASLRSSYLTLHPPPGSLNFTKTPNKTIIRRRTTGPASFTVLFILYQYERLSRVIELHCLHASISKYRCRRHHKHHVWFKKGVSSPPSRSVPLRHWCDWLRSRCRQNPSMVDKNGLHGGSCNCRCTFSPQSISIQMYFWLIKTL